MCDLPLGRCHNSAMKHGVTALGALVVAVAIVAGTL
jgi:hypothetical protein